MYAAVISRRARTAAAFLGLAVQPSPSMFIGEYMDTLSKVKKTKKHIKQRKISWSEIEKCCDKLVDEIVERHLDSSKINMYAIPRGGLIPAVIISHKLNMKMVQRPNRYSIIIDDIEDSGKTLNKYRKNYCSYVLFSKRMRSNDVFSAKYVKKNIWIKFPWENNE